MKKTAFMAEPPNTDGVSLWHLDPPITDSGFVRILHTKDWAEVQCDCCDEVLWQSNTCELGPVEVLLRWANYEVPRHEYRLTITRPHAGHTDVQTFDDESFGLAILQYHDSLGLGQTETVRALRILADGIEAL